MKLTVVTGLSGAGKSVAMHALEDLGYFCVDNLPVGLLVPLVDELRAREASGGSDIDQTAVGIDARTPLDTLEQLPAHIEALRAAGLETELLFFDADDRVLIERFSETRRKHPLTTANIPLAEAIRRERERLGSIKALADLSIDTTRMHLPQLRELIWSRVHGRQPGHLSILLLSFGFKGGLPHDADMVFDARCLPNPHWEPALRTLTGRDREVAEFLSGHELVQNYLSEVGSFLETWIPRFEAENRAYLTVAIGCTGGRHRSVYLVERLGERLRRHRGTIQTRHRELAD